MLVKYRQLHTNNQRGITLILVVLILSDLFIITLILSDIVLRIGKSSYEIGQSEKAYLAAETAIEKAIYTIEAERDVISLGTVDNPVSGILSYSGSNWSSYVDSITKTQVICVDSEQKFSFPDDPNNAPNSSCIYAQNMDKNSDLTHSNPLEIKLKDHDSFRLDFDIENIVYPSYIIISWTPVSPEGEVIILDRNNNSQTIHDTSDSGPYVQIPISGDLNNLPHRITIINKSGSDVIYTIEPSLTSPLPIGIFIHSVGSYKNKQERIINIERKNWQIY